MSYSFVDTSKFILSFWATANHSNNLFVLKICSKCIIILGFCVHVYEFFLMFLVFVVSNINNNLSANKLMFYYLKTKVNHC